MTEPLHIDPQEIVYADLDPSEGIVLNLRTKRYYRLNESGQLIWRELAAGKAPAQIAATLARTYEITPEAALSDIEALIAQLREEQLVAADAPAVPPADLAGARAAKRGKRRS